MIASISATTRSLAQQHSSPRLAGSPSWHQGRLRSPFILPPLGIASCNLGGLDGCLAGLIGYFTVSPLTPKRNFTLILHLQLSFVAVLLTFNALGPYLAQGMLHLFRVVGEEFGSGPALKALAGEACGLR